MVFRPLSDEAGRVRGVLEVVQPLTSVALQLSRTRQRFVLNTLTLIACIRSPKRTIARAATAKAYPSHERGTAAWGRGISGYFGPYTRCLTRPQFPMVRPRRTLIPALVAALIRQESLFHPGAISPVGAIGLMQLRPSTAASLARRAGVPGFRASQLRDPALNVPLGTLHLRDLLDRRAGRVDEVLAAYNAGGSRLTRWKSLTAVDDPDVLLERIRSHRENAKPNIDRTFWA